MVFRDTPEQTWEILKDLIATNEAALPNQWKVETYDPARRERLLPHILGFAIEVDRFEPKFKVNQHYGDADKLSAAEGLERDVGTDDAREIARLMRLSVERTKQSGEERKGVDISTYLDKGKTP